MVAGVQASWNCLRILMGRFVPDAITASVILLFILAGMSLTMGNSAGKTLDAHYQGLWMLLPFTMQMTLIIVLSSALSSRRRSRDSLVCRKHSSRQSRSRCW
ncbi:MAG: hypothetical protein DMF60_08135 [Acidobacteria bacterium]|nr:MAG: hypothetical protein DMF60_08135 [Acidobacteriota bacterium]